MTIDIAVETLREMIARARKIDPPVSSFGYGDTVYEIHISPDEYKAIKEALGAPEHKSLLQRKDKTQ